MATTNIYNPVDLNGALNVNQNNLNNLAKGLNYTGDILKKRAQEQYQREFDNFALQVNSTLNDTMTNLYNSMSDKPLELEREFLKNKNKLLENIKNDDLKLFTEKTYLTTKNIFLDKAHKNNEIRINNETKNNILNTINSNAEFFNLYYSKMFNHELAEEDLANFNYTQENINKLLQTQTLGQHLPKSSLFTETDKIQIAKALNDLKINSAYNFFNEKFETETPEQFEARTKEFIENPDTVRKNYNLTQDEYEKLANHLKRLHKNLDENKTTSKTPKEIINQTALEEKLKIHRDLTALQNKKENRKKEIYNLDEQIKSLVNMEQLITDTKQRKELNNEWLKLVENTLETKEFNKKFITEKEIEDKFNHNTQKLNKKLNKAFKINRKSADNVLEAVVFSLYDLSDYGIDNPSKIRLMRLALNDLIELGISPSANGDLPMEKAFSVGENAKYKYYGIARGAPNADELVRQAIEEEKTKNAKSRVIQELSLTDDIFNFNN